MTQISMHEKYIKLCFEIARKGQYFASPNPLVGCVIIKDDNIIATGYHEKYGSLHAERNAILGANENLEGSTLYCNLEPCMHTDKQTPPCAPLIIASGIKRVVISNLDVNPKVKGKGVQQLKDAGIEVITNVLEDEGYELNKFYFKAQRFGIPHITLKIATSKDGMITEEEGRQTWLTGKESKVFVHKLRAEHDAILIGANTVNIDNPQLTVREIDGKNPKRIIIDGKLFSNLDSNIYNDSKGETIVFCSNKVDESRKAAFYEKPITLVEIETDHDMHLIIYDILAKLVQFKINSLLVEGGNLIFEQFLNSNCFDELFHIQTPVILKKGLLVADSLTFINLALQKETTLGKDKLYQYKNLKSKCLPD